MGQYNALQPQIGSLISNYINNPMATVSPYFNLATQSAVRNANVGNQARMSNLTNNMAALGSPNAGLSAFNMSQINNASRANSANTANAFLQGQLGKAQAAIGVQQTGLQAGMGYKPLQTGSTQTQTQSGLGTWLPQVLSGALGAATGFATGGMSSLFKGAAGPASQMANSFLPTPSSGSGFWNNPNAQSLVNPEANMSLPY